MIALDDEELFVGGTRELSAGGPLVNEWTDYEVPFTFSPAYRPALPKAERKSAREVRSGAASY